MVLAAKRLWRKCRVSWRELYLKLVRIRPSVKMSSDTERIPIIGRRIPLQTKLAYALGHVFNDLAAAMWFSYTLIYLQRIALLEPLTAGALLLLGQLVDALATPVFGLLVDRYTKKKVWHIIGSILVAMSFPMIFGSFLNPLRGISMVTYVMSIMVFQIGWAAVQISHLSMIPMLADSPLVRAELTAIRYSAQVGAAVFVFIVTWIVLPTSEDSVMRLNQSDSYRFRDIVLVVTACGVIATILFHAFLKAHLLENHNGASTKSENSPLPHSSLENNRSRFLVGTTLLLLRVALLYVASRLFITLATVYLPLYIEESDVGGKQALATVPLVSYLASFIASLTIKYMNKSCGSKICYLLGALIGSLAAGLAEFVAPTEAIVYFIAVLIGAAGSITMVTALSVTADFIGPRTENSALVYSIVTFLDKVITGLIVVFIEKWRCVEGEFCPDYNRNALAIVCASSMGLGLIALLSIAR